MLAFVGIAGTDELCDADYLIEKLLGLRIFDDADGKMNLSVQDVSGAILLVSQFTLYGDARKGRRPSFIRAARPEKAVPLYEYIQGVLARAVPVETGRFGAAMEVSLINDGPVTILLDSGREF